MLLYWYFSKKFDKTPKVIEYSVALIFYFYIRKELRAIVHVNVRDNNVEQALRALKKKMQREGIFKAMKSGRYFEKPSERKKREKIEAYRRNRKLQRKKIERDGF